VACSILAREHRANSLHVRQPINGLTRGDAYSARPPLSSSTNWQSSTIDTLSLLSPYNPVCQREDGMDYVASVGLIPRWRLGS